jgi:O-antigen/teichoic acid export membrane protein
MKGDEVVGWYNAAYKIILGIVFIPTSLTAALYPPMSKLYNNDDDSLHSTFNKSFKYLTLIGIPIGVGVTLLAKEFIVILFGVDYMESVLPLQILIWSSVLIFMSQPFGNLLNCLNMQASVMKITGVAALVNVALNIFVIPKYSYIGASVVTVLTEFTSLLLFVFLIRRNGHYFFHKKDSIEVLRIIFASFLMGLFIFVFSRTMNILMLVPLAGIVYFVVLTAIKAIDKDDIALLMLLKNK